MSWDSYVENLMAYCKDASGQGHADFGCIIGLTGAKWTTDNHKFALKISPSEAAVIANCFSTNNFSNFQSNGIVIENKKYQFLREIDGKIVLAKKKGLGALTLQKTKTAIVIAHCQENGQQGFTNKGVSSIAEYLEGQNI